MKFSLKQYVLLIICVISLVKHAWAEGLTDTLPCAHQITKIEKSNGLSINFKLPCDWTFIEKSKFKALAIIIGVPEQARSVGGVVNFIPSELVNTDEIIDLFLSDEELRTATRHSGTYISSRRIKINNYPTGEVLVKAQNQVNGITVYSYKMYNYIYLKHGVVLFTLQVLSDKEKHAKTEFFQRIEFLRSVVRNISFTYINSSNK